MDFEEPVQLAVGDRVICEFMVLHDADKPLPYWGVENVARTEGRRFFSDEIRNRRRNGARI